MIRTVPLAAFRIQHLAYLAFLLLALLLPACTQAAPDRPGLLNRDRDQILTYPNHALDWTGYDDKDLSTAHFTLDNLPIGTGQTGLDNLFDLIRAMPPGSRINIIPYISGEDSHTYPFNFTDFTALIKSRNIYLGVPAAG